MNPAARRSAPCHRPSGDPDPAAATCRRRASALGALVLAQTLLLGGCAVGVAAPQPGFVEVIRRASPAVVGIADERGVVGSGFRIAGTPWVATAAHLVSAPRGALYVAADEARWPVRVLGTDADNDLALLEAADDLPIPGLTLWAGQAPRAGEWIVVLGRPFGAKPTATVGIVSAEPGAVLEPAVLRTRIQLNAAINPGNSGGPVVSIDGRVIGIANGTIPGGFGLGFATPAQAVRALVKKTGQER